MTDLLAERFAALTDSVQGDWLDVRRRAQRRHRQLWIAAAVAAAALVVVAVALAAGGWLFTKHGDAVVGQTTVQFHGAPYTLSAEVSNGGRYLTLILKRGYKQLSFASGNYVLAAPGVPNEPALPNPPAPTGPPVAGHAYLHSGGEIVFGDARPDIGRVVLTDAHRHTFSAMTAAAPVKFQSAFRVWVVALPSSTATTITVYDQHGKQIMRGPFYPAHLLSLH